MKDCRKWGQKLAGSGFRLTTAREVIIDILSKTDMHVSAEDIYLSLHQDHPAIGFTTIYRTLDLLEQTGIVSKFEFGHGRAKYELKEEYSTKKHHHHLICRKCGLIIDYSDFFEDELQYIRKTEQGLATKYNFIIDDHVISFYGLCGNCRKS